MEEYQKLCLALISDAIRSLVQHSVGRTRANLLREKQLEAIHWFTSKEFTCDEKNGISFTCACHILGVDSDSLLLEICTDPHSTKRALRSMTRS